MEKFDPVQTWIANVAYSHSGSEGTARNYAYNLKKFCDFIGMTPQQIIDEYDSTTDERRLRKKYARFLKDFIVELSSREYAVGSISTVIGTIRSFFKYKDLPLGYIPVARNQVTFHNKDITKKEVLRILQASKPRERAFFSMMAQSGLRPKVLCELRRKHIEPDLSKGVIPCCIYVPAEINKGKFGANFSFMGAETIKYLKAYLSTEPPKDKEDLLFSSRSGSRVNRRSITNIFSDIIDHLKEKGLIAFEQKKKGKPREIRLYNLRKFFRKNAGQAGVDYVNFWMGHKINYKAPHIPASDEHYFSREDVEFQRKIYLEKALPFLRFEASTPTETDKVITAQAEKIEKLTEQVRQLKSVDQDVEDFLRAAGAKLDEKLKVIEKYEKLLKAKYPEIYKEFEKSSEKK